MRYFLKTTVYVLFALLYVLLCFLGLFVFEVRMVCWALSVILLFYLFYKWRWVWNIFKYTFIPLALLACVDAYFHGNVMGNTDWSIMIHNHPLIIIESPIEKALDLQFGSYEIYRWSTFFTDCALHIDIYWIVSTLVISCVKYFRSL